MSKFKSSDLDKYITGNYGEDQFGPSPIMLIQECNSERVDEQDVNCTNIEEDMQGKDVVTFICLSCNKEHKSLRLG